MSLRYFLLYFYFIFLNEVLSHDTTAWKHVKQKYVIILLSVFIYYSCFFNVLSNIRILEKIGVISVFFFQMFQLHNYFLSTIHPTALYLLNQVSPFVFVFIPFYCKVYQSKNWTSDVFVWSFFFIHNKAWTQCHQSCKMK